MSPFSSLQGPRVGVEDITSRMRNMYADVLSGWHAQNHHCRQTIARRTSTGLRSRCLGCLDITWTTEKPFKRGENDDKFRTPFQIGGTHRQGDENHGAATTFTAYLHCLQRTCHNYSFIIPSTTHPSLRRHHPFRQLRNKYLSHQLPIIHHSVVITTNINVLTPN